MRIIMELRIYPKSRNIMYKGPVVSLEMGRLIEGWQCPSREEGTQNRPASYESLSVHAIPTTLLNSSIFKWELTFTEEVASVPSSPSPVSHRGPMWGAERQRCNS